LLRLRKPGFTFHSLNVDRSSEYYESKDNNAKET